MASTITARHNMIDGQLEPNQVLDEKIIAAMGVIPREAFVPAPLRASAYVDDNLPIGQGRYLMRPVTLGRLLQEAQIDEMSNVLVVAAGTGYTPAVIALLGAKVTALDESAEWADAARAAFLAHGIRGIDMRVGGLRAGCDDAGPFDVIWIDGAVEELPEALMAQLKEGGRLLSIRAVAEQPYVSGALGRAFVMEKRDGQLYERVLFDATAAVLTAFRKKEGFTF